MALLPSNRMDYSNLRLEKRPPLAILTIDRPKALNALNAAVFAELSAALDEVAADASVRVILLTGEGDRAFAAGADIRELSSVAPEEGQAISLRGQGILRRMETMGKPVIACIRGFALGGGCELAMACTFRIAADDARLGLPEAKLGLVPGYGGSQRLPRLVGRGMALKLLLTGAPADAAEALRIGLVDEVVPAAELRSRAEALAGQIAANAPLAVAAAIELVDQGSSLPLELSLLREAARFGELFRTADKEEGTSAFLEKRAPHWKGE